MEPTTPHQKPKRKDMAVMSETPTKRNRAKSTSNLMAEKHETSKSDEMEELPPAHQVSTKNDLNDRSETPTTSNRVDSTPVTTVEEHLPIASKSGENLSQVSESKRARKRAAVNIPIKLRILSPMEVPHCLYASCEEEASNEESILDVHEKFAMSGLIASKMVDEDFSHWVATFNKQMEEYFKQEVIPLERRSIRDDLCAFIALHSNRADADDVRLRLQGREDKKKRRLVVIPGRKMAELGANIVVAEEGDGMFAERYYVWHDIPARFIVDLEVFEALKSQDIVGTSLDDDTIIVDFPTTETACSKAPERLANKGMNEQVPRNGTLLGTPVKKAQSKELTQAFPQALTPSSNPTKINGESHSKGLMQDASQISPSSDEGEIRQAPGPWQAQAPEWNDKYYLVDKVLHHSPKYAGRKHALSYWVRWKGDQKPGEQESMSHRVGKAALDDYWKRVEEEKAAKSKKKVKREEEDDDYVEE